MNKNLVFASVSAVLLLMSSAIAISRHILPASANFLPPSNPQPAIYIKSNGSVEPADAPIQQAENTYTLTNDITGYTIPVECARIA